MRCNHHLYDMGMHGWDETGPQLCVVCEKLWWPSVLYWDGTEAQWPALTRSYNKGSTTNECEHCPQPPEEALAGRTPWGRVCSRCDHAKTFLHFSKWDLSNDESEEFTRAESYGLLDPVCGPRLDKFGYEYGTFTLSLYCKECEEKLGIFEMRKTCHECESSQPMWRFLEEPYPRWEPCVTDLPLRETCAGCVNNAKIITKKSDMSNKVVYAHIHTQGAYVGRIDYIGKGSPGRPWQTQGRDPEHAKRLEQRV